jgi:hypothetical protein
MVSEKQQQNPYAASTATDVATDTVAWHREFQLVGKTLRCRSGLHLPEYCLVTGHSDNQAPLPLSLWAPGKSVRRYRFWGILLMLSVPLVVFLVIQFRGPQPSDFAAIVIFTTILSLLIAGLVLFLLGGRRGRLCMLQGGVDKRRLTWGRRLAVMPAWLLILVLALNFGGFISNNSLLFPLILFSVSGQFLSGWFVLHGTRLRAVVDEQGVFEISGFSKAFLKRLKEHSDAH